VEPSTPSTTKPRRRWLRTGLKYLGGLLLVSGGVLAVSATFTKIPGEEQVAGGLKRNTAVYVKMTDGTPIAVDIWLPPDIKVGERLPVLTMTTRYWRATAVGWLQRALYGIGLGNEGFTTGPFVDFMQKRRFIILQVDARGTGASGGDRLGEWAPAEVKDYGEVAHWASQQAWSNGNIGAVGGSYEGNAAELYASTGEPSIKAVAPLYDDFDPQMHNSNPGGVFNTGFISLWGKMTGAMDRNDICTVAEASGPMCLFTKWMVPGVKPIDADASGAQLAAILKARKSNNVLNGLSGVEYRDDLFRGGKGLTVSDSSPFSKKAAVEQYQVPMFIMTSWMDAATTDGTLARFTNFKSPQQVTIGAWSHGGGHDADPFAPVENGPVPSKTEQWTLLANFFDKHLRGMGAAPAPNMIRYFTMGERKWHETPIWPPIGTAPRTWYFADKSGLADQTSAGVDANDSYTVNFAAKTGGKTRWLTQLGGPDVVYPDRRGEDTKLLTYTSAPFNAPTTITGTPIVTVHLSTTATDGMIIGYLEDVAPDGRVTYITEGLLRLTNRKETDKSLSYAPLGVNRSFKRTDALPVVPGEIMKVRLPLLATSVQIKAGHRIRIALAGAADGAFDRMPKAGTPKWTVYRDTSRPSGLELPVVK
jgi:uncharacterized protein